MSAKTCRNFRKPTRSFHSPESTAFVLQGARNATETEASPAPIYRAALGARPSPAAVYRGRARGPDLASGNLQNCPRGSQALPAAIYREPRGSLSGALPEPPAATFPGRLPRNPRELAQGPPKTVLARSAGGPIASRCLPISPREARKTCPAPSSRGRYSHRSGIHCWNN